MSLIGPDTLVPKALRFHRYPLWKDHLHFPYMNITESCCIILCPGKKYRMAIVRDTCMTPEAEKVRRAMGRAAGEAFDRLAKAQVRSALRCNLPLTSVLCLCA